MSITESHFSFVKEAERNKSYNDVEADLQRKKRNIDRREFLKNLALIIAVPATLSGWAARELKPKIVTETKLVPVDRDGNFVRHFDVSQLPEEAQRDAIGINYAWQYVIARESYSHISMSHNWDIVSAMSDAAVRREYQDFANPKSNPKAPYTEYGERGSIQIVKDSVTDLAPPEGYAGPPVGYLLRYKRIVSKSDSLPAREAVWQSQMRFKRGVSGIPKNQVYEFNGLGLQIIWYQATQVTDEVNVKR